MNFEIDVTALSGCQTVALIEEIGYEEITLLSNRDELLKHYTDDSLIDEMTNNHDRDHAKIIRELIDSNIVLNDPERDNIMRELERVLQMVDLA